MFVACGIWCFADVSSVSPSSEQTEDCSDEGLTLETSAKHHSPQATNIPYQPLLIKPIFNLTIPDSETSMCPEISCSITSKSLLGYPTAANHIANPNPHY